jgi:hypothetical protein
MKIKQWMRPELIILSNKGTDEVLTLGCKSPSVPVGPGYSNNKCDAPINVHNPCHACMSQNSQS